MDINGELHIQFLRLRIRFVPYRRYYKYVPCVSLILKSHKDQKLRRNI